MNDARFERLCGLIDRPSDDASCTDHVPDYGIWDVRAVRCLSPWSRGHVRQRLGLMPPISDDERHRPLVMLLAHWIYGGALGLLVGAGRQRLQLRTPKPPSPGPQGGCRD